MSKKFYLDTPDEGIVGINPYTGEPGIWLGNAITIKFSCHEEAEDFKKILQKYYGIPENHLFVVQK